MPGLRRFLRGRTNMPLSLALAPLRRKPMQERRGFAPSLPAPGASVRGASDRLKGWNCRAGSGSARREAWGRPGAVASWRSTCSGSNRAWRFQRSPGTVPRGAGTASRPRSPASCSFRPLTRANHLHPRLHLRTNAGKRYAALASAFRRGAGKRHAAPTSRWLFAGVRGSGTLRSSALGEKACVSLGRQDGARLRIRWLAGPKSCTHLDRARGFTR